MDFGEEPEVAVLRELKEETNLTGHSAELVDVWGQKDRDPRGHYITVVYEVKVDNENDLKADDDADDAKFYELKKLLESKELFAFDHYDILREWVNRKQIIF